jgi:hypothetical protein
VFSEFNPDAVRLHLRQSSDATGDDGAPVFCAVCLGSALPPVGEAVVPAQKQVVQFRGRQAHVTCANVWTRAVA